MASFFTFDNSSNWWFMYITDRCNYLTWKHVYFIQTVTQFTIWWPRELCEDEVNQISWAVRCHLRTDIGMAQSNLDVVRVKFYMELTKKAWPTDCQLLIKANASVFVKWWGLYGSTDEDVKDQLAFLWKMHALEASLRTDASWLHFNFVFNDHHHQHRF